MSTHAVPSVIGEKYFQDDGHCREIEKISVLARFSRLFYF